MIWKTQVFISILAAMLYCTTRSTLNNARCDNRNTHKKKKAAFAALFFFLPHSGGGGGGKGISFPSPAKSEFLSATSGEEKKMNISVNKHKGGGLGRMRRKLLFGGCAIDLRG